MLHFPRDFSVPLRVGDVPKAFYGDGGCSECRYILVQMSSAELGINVQGNEVKKQAAFNE